MFKTKIISMLLAVTTLATFEAGLKKTVQEGADYFQGEYDNSYAIVETYKEDAKTSMNDLRKSVAEANEIYKANTDLPLGDFIYEILDILDLGLSFSTEGIENSSNINFNDTIH